MRILVIDDSAAMRRILVAALNREGYDDVIEAASGQEALRHLTDSPVDLIITDWIMPEMDGIELVRAVRAMEIGKDIPVLVVTTNATREHILEALRAGVNSYMVKPFAAETLSQKIRALVGAKAARPA